MATVKISELVLAAAAAGANEFEINESGTSKKLNLTQMLTYMENNIDRINNQLIVDSTSAEALRVDGNTNPYISIYENGSRVGYIQASGTFIIESERHGAPILLRGEDAGGTLRSILNGDPDGDTIIYTAGAERYRTTSAGGTVTGDLIVTGGDITLNGTGRIQGIDTVSANTDAVNKAYVDASSAASSNVVQSHSSTTSSQSITANTITNVTGMSASITPTSSSSRVLVIMRWAGEQANEHDATWGLKRNGTQIGNAPAAGNRNSGMVPAMTSLGGNFDTTPGSAYILYLDSPGTTSSVTYQMTVRQASTNTLYTNRSVNDQDDSQRERMTTTIILMEIPG